MATKYIAKNGSLFKTADGLAQINLQDKTVTPTASGFTVSQDSGYSALNSVVVNGDENLIAENIKDGVGVFGVTGTYAGGVLGTKEITANGTYTAVDDSLDGYSAVTVDVQGGGSSRSYPSNWVDYKALKESETDQAWLFCKGAADTFVLTAASGDVFIVYGGTAGTSPLYKFEYGTGWYKYTSGDWVLNTTQPNSLTTCDFTQADLDNYPAPFFLHFSDLMGQSVVDDGHIGTTELFVVTCHNSATPTRYLRATYPRGTSSIYYRYSVIAYSGSGANGICGSSSSTRAYAYDLEFVDLFGTSISSSAFNGCYSLQTIVIPSNVTSISSSAFYGCSSLQTIVIPSSVTSIGTYAFTGCYSLQTIVIPSNVMSIGNNAFNNCSSLQTIVIPSGVGSIGDYMFQNCSSLQTITIPSSVTSIGNYAFQNCSSLQTIVIPSNVTSISSSAFNGCYSLQTIVIPSNVTSISSSAFQNCSSLQTIVIPSNVTIINDSAFQNCYSLQTIVIPSNVKIVGSNAFNGCYSLLSTKIRRTAAPTLYSVNAFSYYNTYNKILVPYDSITSYQTATNWSSSTNYIKERQRGYGTFSSGDTLPTTTTDGLYSLTWFATLGEIINTAYNGTPATTPITVAPSDGEFYCTITAVV